MAADVTGKNLIVTATAEDHAAVQKVVEQMDQAGLENRSAPRVYRLETADLEDVYEVLQGLYTRSTETRISLDRNQQAIVAIAPPEEHETIKALIEELERGGIAGQGTDLKTYDLGEADGEVVLEMLEKLLDKEVKGKSVRLSILPQNNKLIAVARPKEQELIRKSLEDMKVEDRELEVFQLQTVDPYAAQLAIDALFGSSARDDWSAPSVESDFASQQLFVRGTKEQLENVRNLLIKMGEIQLTTFSAAARSRRHAARRSLQRRCPIGDRRDSANLAAIAEERDSRHHAGGLHPPGAAVRAAGRTTESESGRAGS